MGKIFLIALLGVGGYALYAVSNKVFGSKEEKPAVVERVSDDIEKPEKIVDAVEVDAKVEAEESESKLPEPLFVSAKSGDWIMVHDWGICRVGDWLPCGRILRKWSDRLAVVFDGQKEVVLRFARAVEFPTYRAESEAPVLPNIGGPPAPVIADRPSGNGSGDGVSQLVTDFFGGGSK